MSSNEPEIINPKFIIDNSVILNAVNTLLTSAGFDKEQLNNALDSIKNAKVLNLVDKKQDKIFWLEKIFLYELLMIHLYTRERPVLVEDGIYEFMTRRIKNH